MESYVISTEDGINFLNTFTFSFSTSFNILCTHTDNCRIEIPSSLGLSDLKFFIITLCHFVMFLIQGE